MNPGSLTPAERRDETVASLFKTVHPPMPDDPDQRFKGDLGLGSRRSVRERRDSLATHYLQSIAGLPRHGYDSTRRALRHTVGVLLSDDPAGDVLLETYEARHGLLGGKGEPGTPAVERVVAAAARYDTLVWQLPPPSRHHDVFRTMQADGFDRWGDEETGFWTSARRYVDREEAGRIALAAGQVERLACPPDLYSEDLW